MEMKISLCPLKKNIASQRHDGGKVKVKVLIFTRVARDSTTRLINLCPSVRISYPPPSVSAPFYGYSKLQLHRTEESQNRRRLNDRDRTYNLLVQKAAR